MNKARFFSSLLLIIIIGCEASPISQPVHAFENKDSNEQLEHHFAGKGALLLSRFSSFEQLKKLISIEYSGGARDSNRIFRTKPEVTVTHRSAGREVTSVLTIGVSEREFIRARDGDIWDRLRLGVMSPYAVMYRDDLVGIEILSRRRYNMFGEGDVAFYDIAETTVDHICEKDFSLMTSRDASEKGYLNTFNHITAQAFMTSLFSEKIADFIADNHERYHNPELISGQFSIKQIEDIENGPVDNYIDMINNEWGQELGKYLGTKYHISKSTIWTPQLLSDYLNDIQNYYSWAFEICFIPFRPTDDIVIRYTYKINRVISDVAELAKYYD